MLPNYTTWPYCQGSELYSHKATFQDQWQKYFKTQFTAYIKLLIIYLCTSRSNQWDVGLLPDFAFWLNVIYFSDLC